MIAVQHVADGDYRVVRGGLIYRRRSDRSVYPDDVKSGETVSAAEICEWEELGVEVEAK